MAGQVVSERVDKPRNIEFKGATDLVTDTDKASEDAVLSVNHLHQHFVCKLTMQHRSLTLFGSNFNSKPHLQVLRAAFPDHALLGEEGGISGDTGSEYLWCIDPLDGTTNFAHGYPSFAVSVAGMQPRYCLKLCT